MRQPIYLQPKFYVGLLFIVIVLVQWKQGYFKNLRTYLKGWRFPSPPLWIGMGLALGFSLLLWSDPFVLKAIQSLDSPAAQSLVEIGSILGRGTNLWFFLGLGYGLTYWTQQKTARRILFETLLGSALTGGLAYLLKFFFLRARPYGDLGAYSFFHLEGLLRDVRTFHSLPSGDVAIVAGAASYLFYHFKKNPWRWLLFLFPLSTAFARVSLNRHWPLDTVASLVLSLFVAQVICGYQTLELKRA